VLTPGEVATAAPEPPVTTGPRPVRPAGGQKSARKPKAKPKPKAKAEPAPKAEPALPPELPVPGYDGLSLPSLRARLRNLDAAQLRVLVEYEKSAARRQEVVTMFERRIARLEATAPDAS
jgi:hypothetical protein